MRGIWHGLRTSSDQANITDEEGHMTGGTKAIRTLVAAATIISSLTLPAYADPFSKRPGSGGYSGPPVENHPKVDEKAYKAALERIPDPDKKFDPWGIARPSEPAKPTRKSN
jgi:hypothetical protein